VAVQHDAQKGVDQANEHSKAAPVVVEVVPYGAQGRAKSRAEEGTGKYLGRAKHIRQSNMPCTKTPGADSSSRLCFVL
jgi:hypothetical protein